MTEHNDDKAPAPLHAHGGYAHSQLAKALTASVHLDDAAARLRASDKAVRWEQVLLNYLNGSASYGSRTPLDGIPAWATLEVMTGGFASGNLMAGGPLLDHELALLRKLPDATGGRASLNAWYLTEAGMAQLLQYLRTGCYEVLVPEEGALPTVAWLAANGYPDSARDLIDVIAPFFSRLRFYPVPRDSARAAGARVHSRNVGQAVEALRKVRPHPRIAAQQEATRIWNPLYDRMIALFLETVEQDWPCRVYPDGWRERAAAVVDDYKRLKALHPHCTRFEKAGEHRAWLRELLQRCASDPVCLSDGDIGRIRLILQRYVAKRGLPGSASCRQERQQAIADVSAPSYQSLARVVAERLEGYPSEDGLGQPEELIFDVTEAEAGRSGIPAQTTIPPSVRTRVERCLQDTLAVLVERGLISSGEVLARVLPQVTSGIRAAGIADASLRPLYAAIYRAFRSRRSLLLLNLEKQVQLEELPWIAAINRFRTDQLPAREAARQTLDEITLTALTAFPHALLPNKLIGELEALVKGAGLDLPLVNELASDIFMGTFSAKFLRSAQLAAGLLQGSLYARYYAIDYEAIAAMAVPEDELCRAMPTAFAQLCASRAGVDTGTWQVATNGMIIEQQQILTTQNLATLVAGLDLTAALRPALSAMAMACFTWVCRRQQIKPASWHTGLIMLKNTAYAWRQMMFYLSLMPQDEADATIEAAGVHLSAQSEAFRRRFAPAMQGLRLAAAGVSLDSDAAINAGARQFLGWSTQRHWLLA